MGAPGSPPPGSPPRGLIAPPLHTAILVAIFLVIAAYGTLGQSGAPPGHEPVARRPSVLPLYLSLLVAEWGLLRFTVVGLKRRGVRLRDLLGRRWESRGDILGDAAIGLAAWGLFGLVDLLLERLLPSGTPPGIAILLPRTPAEIAAWIALSVTAGFCEEAIFRGYFQAQFQAITGSVVVAILLQAILFGIAHGYQGWRSMGTITLLGVLFGVLAHWRRNLKPGMIAHAWMDIFSGIFASRA